MCIRDSTQSAAVFRRAALGIKLRDAVEIIAANTNTTSPFPSGAPFDPRVAVNFPTGGTRPICPYPQQTRYKGTGATNVAANFVCVNP